jgi:glucan phosphoethanolaminetransferase (alkaline phosphatase superfamily)
MRKTVLTFGIISGLILSAEMFATLPFLHKVGQGNALIIGYTTMVLAGLLVFFGIRTYRDNLSSGTLTFARAFAVGILITLIASFFYVATWEIIYHNFMYHNFMPDFAEKYAVQMVERAKSSGATQQKIDQTAREAEQFVRNYHNPAYNIGMTFIEVFPVFLLITLLSAVILRRKSAAASA